MFCVKIITKGGSTYSICAAETAIEWEWGKEYIIQRREGFEREVVRPKRRGQRVLWSSWQKPWVNIQSIYWLIGMRLPPTTLPRHPYNAHDIMANLEWRPPYLTTVAHTHSRLYFLFFIFFFFFSFNRQPRKLFFFLSATAHSTERKRENLQAFIHVFCKWHFKRVTGSLAHTAIITLLLFTFYNLTLTHTETYNSKFMRRLAIYKLNAIFCL